MDQKKAVICDDDRTMTHILRHILEKKGFRVGTADDGEEGLALVKETRPQLVVLDLDMPVKTGFEVLEGIQDQAAEAYILVLSNHEGEEKRGRATSLGAREALVKPFSPCDFSEKIDGLIREGRI